MLKLAPILKKIPKDVRVGGHHGSGSHDWKLHEMLPLDPEDGIGPKSITLTPEMAKHNRGAGYPDSHFQEKIGKQGILTPTSQEK